MRQLCRLLVNNYKLHEFEFGLAANLGPESAEEAKTLIPSVTVSSFSSLCKSPASNVVHMHCCASHTSVPSKMTLTTGLAQERPDEEVQRMLDEVQGIQAV